ncbi:RES family NAD+ phosphorylase [Larkinella punicea]|uniref:RES domain-containing protein n=1 Tax=Larkinella punicea TaxID=2315727 RepID=A0A368JFQ7_9BACT|nr:RES family NAD+ phosphorylase [Larkinella punicea]RCR66095.1 RES domain-containing protein [Larkinella punicea]
MRLYRITKTNYANDLNGTGGLYASGRWHREGTLLLYFAEHVSLAMLEMLANSEILPINVSLVTVELPEMASIRQTRLEDLPSDWRNIPYKETLADITERWITEMQFWAMRVPSAHSPTEFNYLLNPLHPEHKTLEVVSIQPISFDRRLK